MSRVSKAMHWLGPMWQPGKEEQMGAKGPVST